MSQTEGLRAPEEAPAEAANLPPTPPGAPPEAVGGEIAPVGPGARHYLAFGALALACGLAGSFLGGRFLSPARPAPPAETAPTTSAPDSQALTERVNGMAETLERVRKQLDDRLAAESPDDLTAMEVRVAELGRSTQGLDALRAQVKTLQDRVDALGNLTDSGRPRSGRKVETTANPSASRPKPPAEPDPSLEKAATLFRQGHYKEAREAIHSLENSQPDDARVWYYAALANGFASGDWTEGTVNLVEKGIACEEAGHPKAAQIDAEFQGLTTATGKDWLAAYRSRVRSRRG